MNPIVNQFSSIEQVTDQFFGTKEYRQISAVFRYLVCRCTEAAAGESPADGFTGEVFQTCQSETGKQEYQPFR